MTFTLHTSGSPYAAADCFFSLQLEGTFFYSPFYPDKSAALLAMEDVVRRLRDRLATAIWILKKGKNAYVIQLFGKVEPTLLPPTIFAQKNEARRVLDELHELAQAATFPLVFRELVNPSEGAPALTELDLTDPPFYNWQEVNTSTLRVDRHEVKLPAVLGASMGVSPSVGSNPCEPLFNVLQPQVAADLPFFLGRKQEVEDLYALTRNNRLLLLYGLPRVGKTSLLQCGLANRLAAIPGELIVHRRGAEGMLPSLGQTLRSELEKLGDTEVPETADLQVLLTRLYERVNKPVFLVFDQLESLFHGSVGERERNEFFAFVQHLQTDDSLPCRIILSLREAFLAPLADYEHHLPALLTHRYHVQPLSKSAMMDVSVNLLDLLKSQGKLNIDQPGLVAEKVCQDLANKDGDVPFQCLQLYFQQAHQTTCAASGGATPTFSPEVIDRLGPAREVIGSYITTKIAELQGLLSTEAGQTHPEIEQQLADLNESRQQCGCSDSNTLAAAAAVMPPAVVPAAAEKRTSNLRWLLLLTLLALLFGILTYWFIYNWLQRQDPCNIAKQADTCEAYVNYLSAYGEEAACAAEFRSLLTNRQCEVWQDYLMIQQTKTCGTYQAFFNKYRHTDVATGHVQQMLLEWACPLVRDTVKVTVRDTVFERTPTSFGATTPRLKTGSSAGCQAFGGSNFKQVGPLWIMTDPLPGGPYSWEEALDACQAKGWRLPCIGEVDFLIANIYRGQAERAYQMLTGSGPCYLVNPQEVPSGRIDFWTGTEANDALAWSFYFDTQTKTIGREANMAKGRRLPCLCVKKDTSSGTTGLPPCFNKKVDRRPG
ncbi:MAG: hypothetical protein DA408_11680 [Bacteroidetes bacterium]|nr:MAG: hypothetical protein C7N36_12695 [Bacteroidota bacterium]PTM12175.1 MAG: hypothetical protein DA408_11680 [Bacteroidota bacterium]